MRIHQLTVTADTFILSATSFAFIVHKDIKITLEISSHVLPKEAEKPLLSLQILSIFRNLQTKAQTFNNLSKIKRLGILIYQYS
ncbi:hypothetical protein BCR21_03450 [Enterococcus ureasiticus]|uniref:Uncharacterized protein n=1 Tax=Enterococcus ureasiticus TaxID=903984 RepID=A0A1E5GPB4_9ENTE|nr:hypothetical protein BCR21_03450 [Enterococcus ureasiticus]